MLRAALLILVMALAAAACSGGTPVDEPGAPGTDSDEPATGGVTELPSVTEPSPAATVPAEGTFIAVAAGFWHTCAIGADGTIACWGVDQSGMLDAPAGQFKAIAAGDQHNCAIRTDGTLVCWGADFLGMTDPPGGDFIAVSAGGSHACALRDDGDVECWGGSDAEVLTPPGGHFAAVAAGRNHTCVLRDGRHGAVLGRQRSRPGRQARGTFQRHRRGGPTTPAACAPTAPSSAGAPTSWARRRHPAGTSPRSPRE